MCVASQILEDLTWATKGALRIDYPIMPDEGTDERFESCRIRQFSQIAVELQLSLRPCIPQFLHEFSTEDATQDTNWQKELVTTTAPDPLRAIFRDSAPPLRYNGRADVP